MTEAKQSSPQIWLSEPPAIGHTASQEVTVEIHLTALAVGSGSLEVLATPMMVALMEKAACSTLEGFLAPGWTSVGTKLDITHSAASPLGAAIVATAKLTNISDRSLDFELTASDNSGPIGSGTHSRFLVFSDKFMAKTKSRIKP
ncbi:MAG: hypothetical protein LBE31_02425 [Deltaproteobacteria bacterium]|jgi:predicted thioesterase|nr:hypothetical protein [Deltaproteobacteria bacterium]